MIPGDISRLTTSIREADLLSRYLRRWRRRGAIPEVNADRIFVAEASVECNLIDERAESLAADINYFHEGGKGEREGERAGGSFIYLII